MKLVIVRHGDPDYKRDCLTEKGKREAELLAGRLSKEPADAYYVSPFGRARETAAPTLERLGREAVVCDWLREFYAFVRKPDKDRPDIPWDLLPREWKADESYFRRDLWYTTELMRTGTVEQEYLWVTGEFDRLLASHGYVRDGELYRAERPNRETVTMFCHFGAECVLLGHMLGIAPPILWHGTCAQTTAVTTLVTEEREEGIASFRMLTFGDVSHLTEAGDEPSFAGRFCEMYSDFSQRH